MSFLLEWYSGYATSATTVQRKAVSLLTGPALNKARRAFSGSRHSFRERRLPLAAGERQSPITSSNTSKVYQSADDALFDLKDGTTVLSAGFGLSGVAGTITSILHPSGIDVV
jgi:3-oxoacid CoA-transferase